jgi:DNA-binding NarL/FixJ family response regulator
VPTCLIVDGQTGVVAALEELLPRGGFEVVATALDASSAVELAAVKRPDCAVVDYCIARGHAEVELIRRLHLASPETAILVYTAEMSREPNLAALDSGASGVLLKDAPLPEVIHALRAILSGAGYVDATVAYVEEPADQPQLSEREQDVLAFVADGLSYAEIGEQLEIGAETARTHLKKASLRLGALTRTHAVAKALRLGLIK